MYTGTLTLIILIILIILNNKRNRKKLKHRKTDYFKRPLNEFDKTKTKNT